MPYLAATASVSFLPEAPKPEVSESRATLVRPRFFMSSNTFSAAMRSVCGVLKTNFLTGSTMTTAPASEMNGMPAFSASGTDDMVAPVVVPPTSDVDLVVLDQALGEAVGLVGIAAVVVMDQLAADGRARRPSC